MPLANAKRLAEASEKTSAADVDADEELLAKAESMRPEEFAREARRWVTDREDDGGESEHRRQRARRCVRIWDGDDGIVHLRGEFDTVTGRRIGNRLRAEAVRMYDADKKNSKDSGERRSFPQFMADALDNLTTYNNAGGGGKPIADICVVAHVDDATGKLIAEIPGGDRLPRSVLEELACNARFTGVVYDTRGRPIWRAHSVRCATEAQRQMLIARDGGCFACGAHPDVCQAHHVTPVSQGGATSIDNMVLACWGCHNKIHYFNWQIHGPPGQRTLHPPDSVTYGTAHAPEQPIPFERDTESAPASLSHLALQRTVDSTGQSDDAGPLVRAGPAAARAALRGTPDRDGPSRHVSDRAAPAIDAGPTRIPLSSSHYGGGLFPIE